MSTDDSLQEVADRLAIQELLYRYADMVDTRDWARIDEVFSEGAQLDYTSTGGAKGGAREVMAWLARALEPRPINLHCITNVRVRFEGTGAVCQSSFYAPMARGELGAQDVISNAGYYEDVLVRTSLGWRIQERVCRQTLMQGELPEG
ncbi:MAG: nuclear transport factor 2 family protein, partial [Myxococcota bacterium]